jgi:hypothetical protein
MLLKALKCKCAGNAACSLTGALKTTLVSTYYLLLQRHSPYPLGVLHARNTFDSLLSEAWTSHFCLIDRVHCVTPAMGSVSLFSQHPSKVELDQVTSIERS